MILFFFFNDTATTEIYTLSLHDALPILLGYVLAHELGHHVQALRGRVPSRAQEETLRGELHAECLAGDRKSTRLNSSHANISYAVFCLKKKKKNNNYTCTYLYTTNILSL